MQLRGRLEGDSHLNATFLFTNGLVGNSGGFLSALWLEIGGVRNLGPRWLVLGVWQQMEEERGSGDTLELSLIQLLQDLWLHACDLQRMHRVCECVCARVHMHPSTLGSRCIPTEEGDTSLSSGCLGLLHGDR